MKEYRVVGQHGQWGEVHSSAEYALRDLAFCVEEYKDRDHFHIEERDVTEWRRSDGKEDTGAEEAEGRREEESAQAEA